MKCEKCGKDLFENIDCCKECKILEETLNNNDNDSILFPIGSNFLKAITAILIIIILPIIILIGMLSMSENNPIVNISIIGIIIFLVRLLKWLLSGEQKNKQNSDLQNTNDNTIYYKKGRNITAFIILATYIMHLIFNIYFNLISLLIFSISSIMFIFYVFKLNASKRKL